MSTIGSAPTRISRASARRSRRVSATDTMTVSLVSTPVIASDAMRSERPPTFSESSCGGAISAGTEWGTGRSRFDASMPSRKLRTA